MSQQPFKPGSEESGPEFTGDVDFSNLTYRSVGPTVQARDASFQVVFTQSALNRLREHGQSRLDAEICGVLVGQVHQDQWGPYLWVQDIVTGQNAAGSAAQVTFTTETWTYIHDVMDRDFPTLRIIGWYHTHPGFGIFLSEMDLFLHGNFFNLPWQIAFVYDPCSLEEGLFVWEEGKTVRKAFLIEMDVPQRTFTPQSTRKRERPAREKPVVVLPPPEPLPSAMAPEISHEPTMQGSRPTSFTTGQNQSYSAYPNDRIYEAPIPNNERVMAPRVIKQTTVYLWVSIALLIGYIGGVESSHSNVDFIELIKTTAARWASSF